MVADLIRDSAFGHLVRLVSKKKLFQYPEEKDPSIAARYYHAEKSANMQRYGQTEVPDQQDDEKKAENHDGVAQSTKNLAATRSRNSSDTQVASPEQTNTRAGAPVDSEKAEKGRDLTIVDWDGPDDPENPVNWSLGKKLFVTASICLLTFSVYIGSAIYSSGEQDVEEVFGVGQVAATLGLSLFVAGYGLGPMVWAPMSEIPQIGRNPVYIATLFVFVLFQIPTALAKNFGMLLAFRFLTGLFGSPVLATGGASLGDLYTPKKRAYAISIWGAAAVCGPTMGPLVGGFAVTAKGWTWTIWELMWLSGFALVFLFFLLPETSSTNILYRKTARLRKLTGNDKLICEPELMGETMGGKEIALMVLVRPITLNFFEPMVFFLNLYIALIYGLLYIWFESFPIVFVEIYGFNLGEEGLAFLGIFVGALVVIPPYWAYLYFVTEPQFDENGNIAPEKRLPPAFVGGPCIVICMFWFSWSAGNTHWIMPIIGSAFFTIGAFLLFNSVLNYLGDAYPAYVASVFAGNDLFRSSFGTGFPLFAAAMYNKLGVQWAGSLLGFLALAFVPIPFVLYYYGRTLRVNHSTHARKDI